MTKQKWQRKGWRGQRETRSSAGQLPTARDHRSGVSREHLVDLHGPGRVERVDLPSEDRYSTVPGGGETMLHSCEVRQKSPILGKGHRRAALLLQRGQEHAEPLGGVPVHGVELGARAQLEIPMLLPPAPRRIDMPVKLSLTQ